MDPSAHAAAPGNASTDPVLLVRDLTKRFPGVTALSNVSFDLRPGEVHALCGENGAGKSTLIKVISGVWPHGSYEGEVRIRGETVAFQSIADAERAGIAVIYQELALVPDMTVGENVFLGNEPVRGGIIDWNRVYAETGRVLKQYGLPLDPAAKVADLGVGQQQLVEIIKALAKHSRILLLDEPTAALTETEVDILLGIVRGLRDQGIACIYISHKLDEVFSIADRITVLRDGRSICTLDAATANRQDVIRHMVGRELTEHFPRRESDAGEVLLRVEHLSVGGPDRARPLLEDISFDLRAGEVLGIGGLMGSGRTELLMHLFGALGRRIRGEVTLCGERLEGMSPAKVIDRGMMLVSEDRKRFGLILEQHIGFNLSLASLAQFRAGLLLNGNAEYRRNQEIFDALGVRAPNLEEEVNNLSGGNQQKVVIGKALMTEPRVIILDEPTRGIDVGAKLEVYNLINEMTRQGKAVVMVSSDLPELMGMTDRILVLSEGKTGGEFTRSNATQESILAAAMAHH